jgi:beta-galactosidase
VNDILSLGPIRAGELHYPRIPKEYWEHRMLSVKALGLNALSVYVFWNLHEIQRGEFDFASGQRDLKAFLSLATKLGFKILIRPGPYVCAEWDFGGLPARLLGMGNVKIRSHNPAYEAEVRIYFKALA